MEEDIFVGKYVLVTYLTENGENVYGGRLERITFEEDECKILFSEFYDGDLIDGKFKLKKDKIPALVSIPREIYRGVSQEPKEKLDEFYKGVNDRMDKINLKREKSSSPKDIKNEKTKQKFYSHGTKIGFKKDSN